MPFFERSKRLSYIFFGSAGVFFLVTLFTYLHYMFFLIAVILLIAGVLLHTITKDAREDLYPMYKKILELEHQLARYREQTVKEEKMI